MKFTTSPNPRVSIKTHHSVVSLVFPLLPIMLSAIHCGLFVISHYHLIVSFFMSTILQGYDAAEDAAPDWYPLHGGASGPSYSDLRGSKFSFHLSSQKWL